MENLFKILCLFCIINILNAALIGDILNGILAPPLVRSSVQFSAAPIPQISIAPGFATQLNTPRARPFNLYAAQFPALNFATAVPPISTVPQPGTELPPGAQIYLAITQREQGLIGRIADVFGAVLASIGSLGGALVDTFNLQNGAFNTGGNLQVQPVVLIPMGQPGAGGPQSAAAPTVPPPAGGAATPPAAAPADPAAAPPDAPPS